MFLQIDVYQMKEMPLIPVNEWKNVFFPSHVALWKDREKRGAKKRVLSSEASHKV